jgi:hypothetical protein
MSELAEIWHDAASNQGHFVKVIVFGMLLMAFNSKFK